MTKGAALQAFFERFLPSYTTASVPEDVELPYLTYELVTSAWEEGEVGITVNLWYYTTNESKPNAMAQIISDTIGMGGVSLSCEGGFIWLKRGAPWCQAVRDDADPMIKRRYINITAEYITLN